MAQQERTFSIIKPDAVGAGHAGQILAMIERAGFRVLAMRMLNMTRKQAEEFYAVHRDKFFFGMLLDYMTSGPVMVMALERENAVNELRELMGATNPEKAAEGTIRKLFGKDIEKNAIHGSDSRETAEAEIPFFFRTVDFL